MEQIVVSGGRHLHGAVSISGSKNGTLPLLAAAMLVEGETVLENVPQIEDVHTMLQMLEALGVHTRFIGPGVLKIDASDLRSIEAPYDLVRRMRASFYVAGPLLARTGRAEVPLPGGCLIGNRPVDLHVQGFKTLGAIVSEDSGVMRAYCQRLRGARVYLDPRYRSLGATINIMLAAVLADGTTVIESASREPEVVSCAQFLRRCGADISGIGGSTITIHGVDRLQGCRFRSIPDRMETGTFMYAAAVAGGSVLLEDTLPEHMVMVTEALTHSGVQVDCGDNYLRVSRDRRPLAADIATAPYPGFPTDLQPCHCVMASVAEGKSIIEEAIFDARYNYTDELNRMGANIRVAGNMAVVVGVPRLSAAPVEATDIRAGAALVLAALAAEGRTHISGAEFLDRGYERLTDKLRGLGAEISRRSVEGKEALCWV
ncbi:MAG: UDP-N-acetylglucosamine 1-carboxyvinyltransferase [candidate division WS1 bacterium]|nr:UDP-N-acetylglucosamine 1-carboxyvinyltransferase [candidate division WS1 bacterium]